MTDEVAGATTTGVARVFDLHALKAFGAVRNLGADRCVIMFLRVNPRVLEHG